MRRVVGQYPVKKVFPHWYEWREAGVRGIPSPFIKIYERGRDTPHPGLLPLLLTWKDFLEGIPAGPAAACGCRPPPCAMPRTARATPAPPAPEWRTWRWAGRRP